MPERQSRTKPCDYDGCELVGECDGRHCLAAGGAIRPTPDEELAAWQRGELRGRLERVIAAAIYQPQPCMSGDVRDRLNSTQRRAVADATLEVMAIYDERDALPANGGPDA